MDKETLINGNFENSLSQNQLMEFEQLLKIDPDFIAEVDFRKELQRSLKKNERYELKQLFEALNKKTKNTETKVFHLRPWLAAASIALLIALGSWLLFFNNPAMNTDQLYAANFAPYDNVVHPIERGNAIEDLKTNMFAAYEAQDYELWLALSEQMTIKQKDDYIDFYSAVVYMQLDNHQKAIPLLEGYINNNGELKDRATWYLALAHLKLKETRTTKKALKRLIQMGTFKKEVAKKLLKALS